MAWGCKATHRELLFTPIVQKDLLQHFKGIHVVDPEAYGIHNERLRGNSLQIDGIFRHPNPVPNRSRSLEVSHKGRVWKVTRQSL